MSLLWDNFSQSVENLTMKNETAKTQLEIAALFDCKLA